MQLNNVSVLLLKKGAYNKTLELQGGNVIQESSNWIKMFDISILNYLYWLLQGVSFGKYHDFLNKQTNKQTN